MKPADVARNAYTGSYVTFLTRGGRRRNGWVTDTQPVADGTKLRVKVYGCKNPMIIPHGIIQSISHGLNSEAPDRLKLPKHRKQ